jgi:crossover junction endodeoxyribonuclease RusA
VTARTLVVDVLGDPAPQGSKRFVGNGRMVESSAKLAPWRDNVAWRVRESMTAQGWVCLDAACVVTATFKLARPVSAPKSRLWPDRKPDLDKLARAVLDSLVVAGALSDDARVVRLNVAKVYADALNPVGVRLEVGAT